MTGALRFAVDHAHLVEALEECAPPVASRYLREAIERCKLAVHVEFQDTCSGGGWLVYGGGYAQSFYRTAAEATSRYLDLCHRLSQSAALPNPPADAGAQCTGTAATDSPSVAATISDPEHSTLPVSGSSANSAGATATLAEPAAFSSDGVL